MFHKPVIIGIAGGSASGKTSIAAKIRESFEDGMAEIIRMDDYYNDQSNMTMEERLKVNYDHPFAFDVDLLIKHLKLLISGTPVEVPTYSFVEYTRAPETRLVNPTDVIILEGLFVLEEPRIRDFLDIKVFVDTDADIRFIRRLVRDVKKRGRTLDSVVNQWVDTVRVTHNSFIEPSKRYADIIIPEGSHNTVAIDLLNTKIQSIIAQNKETTVITVKEYDRIIAELTELRTVELPKVRTEVRTAMASGIDLSENEMYDTAKAKEKEIWDRMQVLEDILQNAVADNEKK
ncbi:MAG: uridine kinase [Erysipelotrichales bacterium]|nr:uridine kinase [Erysipelotrichales bacterium]